MNSPSVADLEKSKPIFSAAEFASVDPSRLPTHIGIIMDGNRRWARKQDLPSEMGHWQGAEQLDIIVRAAAEIGIKTLTVYSFSTENWQRSKGEVEMLMQLLEAYLRNKREALVKEGVRLSAIGDVEGLPPAVRKTLAETAQATKNGGRIELVLALNYGGRDEIRRAFLKMREAEEAGQLDWRQVTEQEISSYLDTAPWGDPELLIRPSGEWRVSNFLIWQSSYSEIYFTDVLWPDFSPKDLLEAIVGYQNRSRRHGR